MLYSRFSSYLDQADLFLIIIMNSRSKRISVKCHIRYPHSAQCQAANAQCPTWREDSFSKFLKQSLLWTLCLMQRNALLAIKRRSIFLHIPIFSFILLTTGGLKNALKLRVARTPDFTLGRKSITDKSFNLKKKKITKRAGYSFTAVWEIIFS